MTTRQYFTLKNLPQQGMVALPLLLGVLLLFNRQSVPAAQWSVLLFPLLLVALRVAWLRPLSWLLLGFLWAAFQADLRLSVALPEAVEGQDLQLVGTVEGVPSARPNGGYRFLFAVESARYRQQTIPFVATVRLNWYRAPQPVLSQQRWQLTARLKPPHGFSNPGGFDWERWLFEQDIRASGYVREGESRLLSIDSRGVDPLRESLSQWIRHHDRSGLLAALAVGDRQGISPRLWEQLRATGISHLMAISGLHIGLVATLLYLLLRRLWSWTPRLPLYLPAQQAGAVAAIVAALLYAALAGFSVPTQRALIMVITVMGVVLLRRSLTPWSGYFMALAAVLLFDPFVVLSSGFWLSFSAVGWIILALPGRHQESSRWLTLVKIQLVLLIGMLPLLLYLFQQGSLVAPLVNLLVVPWVSLLIVPLLLLAVLLQLLALPGAEALLSLTVQLLEPMMVLVEWFASLSYSHFVLRQPALWMVLLASAGAGLLFAGRWWGRYWLAPLLWLPLLLWPPPRPAVGEAWVTLLDVGQGLAVVVESHDRVMLYDTGDRFSATFDAGSAVVVPFLRARGWQAIDLLLVGHEDRDHIGGLEQIVKRLAVVDAYSSVPQRVAGSRPCHAGQHWSWSGVEIALLHPGTGESLQGNDGSCVVRIATRGGALLLTGDIEYPAEQLLLQRSRERLDVEVVVVPHHGSETSSSQAWVEAVSPAFALFPVGYLNRYRLPRSAVVERYQQAGAAIFSTARHGAIEVRLGEAVTVSAWRSGALKIWSHRPAM
jgi:competence protein ComEC